jgi:N-carbamoyl-L-amino-acid hydrolase
MPVIDPRRFLADLEELSSIGRFKTGVSRPTFSAADQQARAWLANRLHAAGLRAVIDGIGNVIGCAPGAGPKLLLGSHIESQPEAGRLDGALGLLMGLEVARALRDDPDCAGLGVDVAAWADEEAYYGSFLGSRSFIGELTEAEMDSAVHRTDGTPLRTALREAGYSGPRATVERGRHLGYLEAHVEQGDYLEQAGHRIGIVTGIVGSWQYRVIAYGQQNHAGTTRMAARKDAGLALAKLIVAIDQQFPKVAGARSVWTVGRVVLEPGAPSVIPGRAELSFQFRDADIAVLQRMDAAFDDLIAEANRGPCAIETIRLSQTRPALMAENLLANLEVAAELHAPARHTRMPSAAGHDAQILSRAMPAAMLFVPSIGGISHHWSEDTHCDDMVLGTQILADSVAAILRA